MDRYRDKGVVVSIEKVEEDIDERLVTIAMLDPVRRVRKIITDTMDRLNMADWIQFEVKDGKQIWTKLAEKVLPTKPFWNGKVIESVTVKCTVIPTTEPVIIPDTQEKRKAWCIGFSREVGRVLIAFENPFPKHSLLECNVASLLHYPEESQFGKVAKVNGTNWILGKKSLEEYKQLKKAEAQSKNFPFVNAVVVKTEIDSFVAFNGDYGTIRFPKSSVLEHDIEIGSWVNLAPVSLDIEPGEPPQALGIFVMPTESVHVTHVQLETSEVFISSFVDIPKENFDQTTPFSWRMSCIGKINDTSSLVLSRHGGKKLQLTAKFVFEEKPGFILCDVLDENEEKNEPTSEQTSQQTSSSTASAPTESVKTTDFYTRSRVNQKKPANDPITKITGIYYGQTNLLVYAFSNHIVLGSDPILRIKKTNIETPNLEIGNWLQIDLDRRNYPIAARKIPDEHQTRVRKETKNGRPFPPWVEVRVIVERDPMEENRLMLKSYDLGKVIDKKSVLEQTLEAGKRLRVWCKRVDTDRRTPDTYWAISDTPEAEEVPEGFSSLDHKVENPKYRPVTKKKYQHYHYWDTKKKVKQLDVNGEEIDDEEEEVEDEDASFPDIYYGEPEEKEEDEEEEVETEPEVRPKIPARPTPATEAPVPRVSPTLSHRGTSPEDVQVVDRQAKSRPRNAPTCHEDDPYDDPESRPMGRRQIPVEEVYDGGYAESHGGGGQPEKVRSGHRPPDDDHPRTERLQRSGQRSTNQVYPSDEYAEMQPNLGDHQAYQAQKRPSTSLHDDPRFRDVFRLKESVQDRPRQPNPRRQNVHYDDPRRPKVDYEEGYQHHANERAQLTAQGYPRRQDQGYREDYHQGRSQVDPRHQQGLYSDDYYENRTQHQPQVQPRPQQVNQKDYGQETQHYQGSIDYRRQYIHYEGAYQEEHRQRSVHVDQRRQNGPDADDFRQDPHPRQVNFATRHPDALYPQDYDQRRSQNMSMARQPQQQVYQGYPEDNYAMMPQNPPRTDYRDPQKTSTYPGGYHQDPAGYQARQPANVMHGVPAQGNRRVSPQLPTQPVYREGGYQHQPIHQQPMTAPGISAQPYGPENHRPVYPEGYRHQDPGIYQGPPAPRTASTLPAQTYNAVNPQPAYNPVSEASFRPIPHPQDQVPLVRPQPIRPSPPLANPSADERPSSAFQPVGSRRNSPLVAGPPTRISPPETSHLSVQPQPTHQAHQPHPRPEIYEKPPGDLGFDSPNSNNSIYEEDEFKGTSKRVGTPMEQVRQAPQNYGPNLLPPQGYDQSAMAHPRLSPQNYDQPTTTKPSRFDQPTPFNQSVRSSPPNYGLGQSAQVYDPPPAVSKPPRSTSHSPQEYDRPNIPTSYENASRSQGLPRSQDRTDDVYVPRKTPIRAEQQEFKPIHEANQALEMMPEPNAERRRKVRFEDELDRGKENGLAQVRSKLSVEVPESQDEYDNLVNVEYEQSHQQGHSAESSHHQSPPADTNRRQAQKVFSSVGHPAPSTFESLDQKFENISYDDDDLVYDPIEDESFVENVYLESRQRFPGPRKRVLAQPIMHPPPQERWNSHLIDSRIDGVEDEEVSRVPARVLSPLQNVQARRHNLDDSQERMERYSDRSDHSSSTISTPPEDPTPSDYDEKAKVERIKKLLDGKLGPEHMPTPDPFFEPQPEEELGMPDSSYQYIGVIRSRDPSYHEDCYYVYHPDLSNEGGNVQRKYWKLEAAYITRSILKNVQVELGDWIRFNVHDDGAFFVVTELKKISKERVMNGYYVTQEWREINYGRWISNNTIRMMVNLDIPQDYNRDRYNCTLPVDISRFEAEVTEIQVFDEEGKIETVGNFAKGKTYEAVIIRVLEPMRGNETCRWKLDRLVKPVDGSTQKFGKHTGKNKNKKKK